jgi:hypothetical protein
MHSDGPISGNSDLPQGLPPVEPPSGRFLAQLFLVPLLIVTVLVVLAVAGLWWSRGRYGQNDVATSEHFVRDLESDNADVWWRSAHELAQVIKRPEGLAVASHPKLALELADKLSQELAVLEREEKVLYEQTRSLPEPERQAARQKAGTRLEREKKVLFLISALGDFTVPVGVPLLGEIALKEDSPDIKAVTLRQRRAVWALANLGQNLKRWPELSKENQARVIQELAAESAGQGPRAAWARLAHDYIAKQQPLHVDALLEKCARSEDTYLRALVAMALNFWEGPRVVPTLHRLADDDGHGTRIEITDKD